MHTNAEVCMHIKTYVAMYVYTVSMYICMYVCMYCTLMPKYVCMCVCMYAQVLGKVINALVEAHVHVPYYESKLTILLKAAFGDTI